MNIGDTFVDPQKRTWTVEEQLGRGTWGRSFRARSADGQQCVLKVALGASDFPPDAPLPDGLVRACRDAAREQIALLERGEHAFLPRLIGSFTLSNGSPALMLAHYAGSLERRIAAGVGLSDIAELVARLSRALGTAGFVHGNLRPSNVLVNDRGEPVAADAVTPALAAAQARLEAFRSGPRWRPPEATDRPRAGWDTWALCQALYQAALHREPGTDTRTATGGLDRVEIATIKDRALARFRAEGSNTRFQARMAERLGTVLHRGLSLEAEPSPPYRFADGIALADRLDEVVSMFAPRIEDLGRLLPPAESVSGVFRGEKPVEFTVSVGCSPGVTNHEDVVCGLKLVDLDQSEARVAIPEARYVAERHRSGRMRFQFTIPDLGPGRYRLKIAFSVRDSGDTPLVAVSDFEVRPRAGYVPPVDRHEPKAPILLDRVRPSAPPEVTESQRPSAVTSPGIATSSAPRVQPLPPRAIPLHDQASNHDLDEDDEDAYESDPGGEVIEGFFPRPVAPPTDQPTGPIRSEHPASDPGVRAFPSAPPAATPPYAEELPEAANAGGAWGGARPSAVSNQPRTMDLGVPRPGIAMPVVSIAPPALLSTPPAVASYTDTPVPAPPLPMPNTRWFAGPLDQDGLNPDGLPGLHEDGEELPDWSGDRLGDTIRSLPGLQRLTNWMQRDTTSAFVAAAAGSFVLLLVMMALVKAF